MKLKSNIAVSESGFMFDAGTGDSYSLNPTGKAIINLLNEGKSEAEIIDFFAKNYDVEKNIFEHNFHDFLSIINSMNLTEEN
jgi:hypothetical protein